MTRRTLLLTRTLLASTLALLTGCRDGAPPSEGTPVTGAPAAPEPALTASARFTKVRPMGARALAPGARRSLFQVADQAANAGEGSDAGDAPDAAPVPARTTWSFDLQKTDDQPPGFEFAASAGKPGKWRVQGDPTAANGPNVLAQLEADKTDARFLTAVATEPSLRDARVSVRCKPVSGKVDQSCGLVARFKDPKSYYVVRANALEKDVNLYIVKDGKRSLVSGWKGVTVTAAWHELRLDAKGDHLEVYWDGAKVNEVDDKTFPDAGRFGLWTKADSVTYFDDFSIQAL